MQKTWKEMIKEILIKPENLKGIHVDDIARQLLLTGQISNHTKESLSKKISLTLSQDIRKKHKKSDFAKISNNNGGHKRGYYRFKKQSSPQGTILIDKPSLMPIPDTNYTGIAGEFAVMSELLFRGFNASSMAVDEGVDVVAFKNDKYFYIQVKTSNFRDRFYTSINTKKFETFNATGRYYIFVLRYRNKQLHTETNSFIIMSSSTLQTYIDTNVISKGNSLNISISIVDGRIMLNNKADITVFQNRFDYIK